MTLQLSEHSEKILIEKNAEDLMGKIENLKEYDTLEQFDFGKFDTLLRKFKRKYFDSDGEFDTYKKWLLETVTTGEASHPLLKLEKGRYQIVSGKMRILCMKLLGISPMFNLI